MTCALASSVCSAPESDTLFGGAGRDTLLGNTGADRMVDWVGEFNTYIVPFAAFGAQTVHRLPAPWMRQFFLDMAKADGADQTLAEPLAELALVDQKAPAWQDQNGAPTDGQAGNESGGKKDTK